MVVFPFAFHIDRPETRFMPLELSFAAVEMAELIAEMCLLCLLMPKLLIETFCVQRV